MGCISFGVQINVVGFVGTCVGDAGSFNDRVVRGMLFSGARSWRGCFDCAAVQHHAW